MDTPQQLAIGRSSNPVPGPRAEPEGSGSAFATTQAWDGVFPQRLVPGPKAEPEQSGSALHQDKVRASADPL